jgi:hypothetical protein
MSDKPEAVQATSGSSRAESIEAMHPLFQADQSGANPTSALDFRVDTIRFELAKRLNCKWHSRLPRMGTGFIKQQPFLCFAAHVSGRIFAVAIWSNPVARNLPQQTCLELRRMAIGPGAPKNLGSRFLAVMRRLILKFKPQVTRLISYQDTEVHSGTIYKAAGWYPVKSSSDGNWNCPSRPRPQSQSYAAKIRWEFLVTQP